jgi:phosphohistidine phosphatase
MRHAEAESPRRYAEDRLRPLTAQGQARHQVVARALSPLLQPLDHLLTSPFLRARQTADIMAAALTCASPVAETPFLADACTIDNVLSLLQDYPQDARILCVGHQPYVSRLAAVFLDGEGRSAFAFEPGSAIGITFQAYPAPGAGLLRFFLRPTDLLLLPT